MKFVRRHEKAILPTRGTPQSAGLDLSYCGADEVIIPSGNQLLLPTGWSVELPPGTVGKIESRSGASLNQRLTVRAGVIDADYRGEIKVILVNESDVDRVVKTGDRIAQLLVYQVNLEPAEEVFEASSTQRGEGGFGSTDASS